MARCRNSLEISIAMANSQWFKRYQYRSYSRSIHEG
jgi:hypothetical protein